ncbi:MAG TPA: hypothetical protein VM032_13335 [Vicinamibacterales bacterium]|nr:hypothetical protein [Vicinamibacterales bacterium]
MIRPRITLAAALAASLAFTSIAHPAAQQRADYPKPSPSVPYTPAAGRCLTAEQRKVNDAYNSLTRPTQPGDEMPFWDPEYLVGVWDIDMRSQDSPFGPGGQSIGTLTMKPNEKNGCLYDGSLKGEDPDGKPFSRTITVSYDPNQKLLSWTEKDSRGYTIVKQGPVGGELGGLFHHHFGDDPSTQSISFSGRKIRVKGISEMSSPAFFKTDMQISIDGAPYVSYGRVTYSKQLPDEK